jgi:superfamily II DNA or RNA helicase
MYYTQKNSLSLAALFQNTSDRRYAAGLDYYDQDRVQIKSKAKQCYKFTVQGSRAYETTIFWETQRRTVGVLDVKCTCFDYLDNEVICKHIVASMRYLLDLKTDFNAWERSVKSMDISELEATEVSLQDDPDYDDGYEDHDDAGDEFGLDRLDGHQPVVSKPHPMDVFVTRPYVDTNIKKQQALLLRTLRLKRIQGDLSKSEGTLSVPATLTTKQASIQVWYELQGRLPGDARWPTVRLRQRNVSGNTKTERALRNLSIRPDESSVRGLSYGETADYDLVYDLAVANNSVFYTADTWSHIAKTDQFALPRRQCVRFLRKIIATNRALFLSHEQIKENSGRDAVPLFETQGEVWKPKFWVAAAKEAGLLEVKAAFYVGQKSIDISRVSYMAEPGIAVLATGQVLFFDECAPAVKILLLEIAKEPIQGTAGELKEIILNLMAKVPRSDLDLEQGFADYGDTPNLQPKISLLRSGEYDDGVHIPAVVAMTYGERSFSPLDPNLGWYEEPKGLDKALVFHRDLSSEGQWLALTKDACEDLKMCEDGPPHFNAVIARDQIVPVMLKAMELGWAVELQGKKIRAAKAIDIKVSSGIDWFDVKVTADLGDGPLDEADLLRLLRGRQRFTTLADGSMVINTSEALLRNAAILERFANEDGTGTFRIPKLHAMLLDLEEERLGTAKLDGGIDEFLAAVQRLQSLTETKPGPEFNGVLRPYQAAGLGWLKTLRDTKLGGCLADDMGLGKTIQVLAHLSDHYAKGAGKSQPDTTVKTKKKGKVGAKTAAVAMKPSLLVVPRSLVFNWRREAAKFAPNLRTGELNNQTKSEVQALIKQCDVIIATYAMTRSQLETLKDIDFEYLILDEAQAIKNASSQSARSVKVLKAEHRLALSGTPVENHLSDLTSIFEFINPGLSAAKGFHKSMTKLGDSPEGRQMLGRILKPFILRRTKGQVLKDLPAKTETIIYCDLSPEEQDFYTKLSQSVRANLQAEIKAVGIAKAQIHILSALTRLRQAACDRRLLGPQDHHLAGTKIDLLFERIKELSAEGQKAVVFSQFTQFLALAKQRLDDENIAYCYLDGQTKDRQKVVDQFNSDAGMPVFLVSLKAGGVGLNLTSASHCFLLDPWWNPAAEAQAIDRLHRIGQRNPVFAYRLIGRGTVEEKILQLQEQKRGLADAVINGQEAGHPTEGPNHERQHGQDEGLADAPARGISIEDLELLLG